MIDMIVWMSPSLGEILGDDCGNRIVRGISFNNNGLSGLKCTKMGCLGEGIFGVSEWPWCGQGPR